MGLKEKINIEIDNMARNELALLYEQIKIIKKIKKLGEKERDPITIEELRKRTSSSKDSWAEDVIKSREDRI
jgi:CRISPR/Cas system-associated endoribonuclease Cas2